MLCFVCGKGIVCGYCYVWLVVCLYCCGLVGDGDIVVWVGLVIVVVGCGYGCCLVDCVFV